MPTNVIDGTVEEADLKTDRSGIKIFRSVRFKLTDGSEHTVEKAVCTKAVGDELVPGAKGRFYQFNAFDIKGIHGVRMADGKSVYGFPGNNQKIFLISGVVAALWIVVTIFARGGVPLLGVGLLILSGLGYHFMSKGKREAQAQFDGDAGYRGAA